RPRRREHGAARAGVDADAPPARGRSDLGGVRAARGGGPPRGGARGAPRYRGAERARTPPARMKGTILASGSEGHAGRFASGETRVLVDAGIGPRTLVKKLREAGAAPPDAIVITHAHQDHVGHAVRLSRRLKIPIYASEATARCEELRGREQVRVYSPRE